MVGILGSQVANAEPIGEDAPPRSTPAELTAADVEGGPPPGQESGQVDAPRESTARMVGRGVLWLPKLAVTGTLAPIRAGVWAYERYHLEARAIRLFFNDDETYGIYPVADVESELGVTAGARFVHRDLFGARERLGLHAAFGGRYRELASAKLRSGDRFGSRLTLELTGEYERRPHDPFYGVGDDGSDVAVTRFREQLLRATALADARLSGPLHLRMSGAIADFDLGPSDEGPPIEQLHPDVMSSGDVRQTYLELELRWDSRRAANRWQPAAIRSTGWLLSGFTGRAIGLDDSNDFTRYGVDLQRFISLGRRPRVLSARLYGEGVTGDVDQLSFSQLPRLGGKILLRGYPLDRFRDRVAVVGSLEYAWDLNRFLTASTFVDAGRVAPAIDRLDIDDLRVGYGVAIQAHSERSFLIRASLASSLDGGVFAAISFDPVFDLDPRVERR